MRNFCLIIALSFSQITYAGYDNLYSSDQINEKLKIMIKHGELKRDYIEVTDKYFFLYASSADKVRKVHEYKIKLKANGDESKQKARKERKSLSGLKIAIDPGHFGGHLASLEERKIRAVLPEGLPVEFNEGDLNLATGLQLKKMLESKGANVFITKKALGQGAYDLDWKTWRDGEGFLDAVEENISHITDPEQKDSARKLWFEETTENKIFRTLYNPLDLKARSEMLMDFGADLTFVIHYNAGSTRNKEENKNILTKENYSMFFTGGSYLRGELSDEESRTHFVRQLFSNSLEESKDLSVYVIKELIKRVGVNPVSEHNDFPQVNYLRSVCVGHCDGVYARNMQLTRAIPGVLCYTEPLLMDNELMAKELGKTSYVVDGIETSPLTKTLAEVYFAATLSFYKLQN